MENFVIITDSSADLPKSYLDENKICTLSLSCTMDGVTFDNDNEEAARGFYAKLRSGSMPTTSQVNPDSAEQLFKEMLEINKNILCIAFSSGLSGTYNSWRIAAEEVMSENSEANIVLVDSLCASLGQGLLVHKAVAMRDAGKSLEETAEWIEQNKLNLVHIFTVDDLNHLYRGGRLSKTAAIMGTMINLKPILHVDNEGHLINIQKVRGRRKALGALVDYMEKRIGSYRDKNDIIFISHGDNIEDAQFIADEIKKKFGYTNFLINPIGPTIGSHAGPDTIALFFFGEER